MIFYLSVYGCLPLRQSGTAFLVPHSKMLRIRLWYVFTCLSYAVARSVL